MANLIPFKVCFNQMSMLEISISHLSRGILVPVYITDTIPSSANTYHHHIHYHLIN